VSWRRTAFTVPSLLSVAAKSTMSGTALAEVDSGRTLRPETIGAESPFVQWKVPPRSMNTAEIPEIVVPASADLLRSFQRGREWIAIRKLTLAPVARTGVGCFVVLGCSS
jgi:hypothetical protein